MPVFEVGAAGAIHGESGKAQRDKLKAQGQGQAVTMPSERERLARSRRPNHGRASFGRRTELSLNGAPQAVVWPNVFGLLSTP